MRHTLHAAARLALVLALLCGWHASLLHPLKHVDDGGRLVHVAGKDAGGEKKPGSDPADKLCDALAGLAACVSGSPPASLQFESTEFASPDAFREPRASTRPPFFAQGPPNLL